METIATFTDQEAAEKTRQALDAQNHLAKVVADEDNGLFSVQVSKTGPAPDSVSGFEALATENGAITCLECASPEVQYPASPGDQWVLPQIVAKVASAVATDSKNHFRCRKCDYEWAIGQDSRVPTAS